MDVELADLRRKMLNVVHETVQGSAFGPSNDEPAMLVDCVVIMGWCDDEEYTTSALRCGSPWGSRGLVHQAYHDMIGEIDVEDG